MMRSKYVQDLYLKHVIVRNKRESITNDQFEAPPKYFLRIRSPCFVEGTRTGEKERYKIVNIISTMY